MKPLVIDLCCGLGGWTRGFLAEGYEAVGFDIERHVYGDKRYPAQLVLQDITTLHGSQFKDAACIVASPPCQGYSYRAMPWKRAKALPPPDNSLFEACFRIQREANEAQNCTCGHPESEHEHDYLNGDDACCKCSCIFLEKYHIPIVVENVKAAQPWVGRAAWHYGSFYLWGDVPALMPSTQILKRPGRNFHAFENGLGSSPSFNGGEHETRGLKTTGHANKRDGFDHTRHLTNQRESDAVKVSGVNWNGHGTPGYKAQGFNVTAAQRYRAERDGIKQPGHSGRAWFADPDVAGHFISRCDSRKAASALIAEIPFDLASHIARVFKPAQPMPMGVELRSSALEATA